MRGENLQFDQFCRAGQQLGRLQDCAVFRRRPVYGQQVIPSMQRSAPERRREEEDEVCLAARAR